MTRENVIHPSAVIADCVELGWGVRIDAGVCIGFQGMVGSRNYRGEIIRKESHGGVIIKNNVWIGAGTVIQRGQHGDTIIEENSHIDLDCHIAHDCKIGKSCMIIASSTLAGVVTLGDFSYLGLGSVIRDGITIGKRVTVGMGSVVTKDIPGGWTVVGNPAMRIEKFREQRKKLESISLLKQRKVLWNKIRGIPRKIRRFFRRERP